MLLLQAWRAFERHGAARIFVSRLDLGLRKAQRCEKIEALRIHLFDAKAESGYTKLFTKRPFVEHEFDVEGTGKGCFHSRDLFGCKAFPDEGFVIDVRRISECAAARSVSDDRRDLLLLIAKRPQGHGNRAVNDFEIPPAGKLFELHQREV